MIRALWSLSVVLLLCLGGTATAQPKEKVAILGLEVSNANIDAPTTQVAANLTRELRNQPKAGRGPYTIAPNSEKELLDEKLMNSCETEEKTCMARIGDNLKAEYLIWGKVEKKSQGQQVGYQVRLTLLNVRAPNGNAPSHTDFIPAVEAEGPKLAEWGRKFYARLTNAEETRLVINANIEAGAVLVEGVERGRIVGGRGELTDLPPGRYRVSVVAEGFQRWDSPDAVTVRAGEETLEVTLTPLQALPCDPRNPECQDTPRTSGRGAWKAVFATGLVIAAGGGGFALYSHLEKRKLQTDECKLDPMACGFATADERDDEGFRRNRNANLGWGVVGVGAAVAAIGLYKGYLSGGSERANVASRTRRPSNRRLSLTPVLGPERAGAVLYLDW